MRILQEEKMETFIKNEEKRKLNFKLKNIDEENEEEKSNLKNNDVDINVHKKTRKLRRQERKQETEYFDLKDEIHVRNYLKTESEKNEKNEKSEQNLKSNFRRKILETDVNYDLNNKNNKNNKNNNNNRSIEFEMEEENKIEDSGVHLSEGYVYVYIASDNEVVKEAFAEFLKEFHSHIRGENSYKKNHKNCVFIIICT